jgi:L-amino acid N-acyltransferase YncA
MPPATPDQTATIRPTHARDYAPIADLTNRYILHTSTHFGTMPLAVDDVRDLHQGAHGRYPWLTLDVRGAFAGYAKAGPWRTREAYSWTAEAGIYLTDDAIGKGLGARLYGALIDELRAAGFHSVIGGITLPNPASTRLHERLGFVHVGTFARAGHKMGRWHDVGFWQLMLREASHTPDIRD